MTQTRTVSPGPNLADDLILKTSPEMAAREKAFQDQQYDPDLNDQESAARPFEIMGRKMQAAISAVARQEFSPEQHKVLRRTWNITDVSSLVGKSTQTIRRYEEKGAIPPPTMKDNRRTGYTLDAINDMRAVFETQPYRSETDTPAVLSFQNFKGGCGKSTLLMHAAHFLAIKGYRALIIDCDPQGTTSLFHGLSPGILKYLEPQATSRPQLFEYLLGEVEHFADLIVPSYFPGVDIIPTSLDLFNAEYTLAAELQSQQVDALSILRDGIQSVWDSYDVILLDPPPALGMLSMSAAVAANAFVIPMRSTMHDFASTCDFLSMISQNIRTLEQAGYRFSHGFISMLPNAVQETQNADSEMLQGLRDGFSQNEMLSSQMVSSTEIKSAGLQLKTVYDLEGPISSSSTYKRCINCFDAVNRDIETRIRRLWPSHHESLRSENLL